MDRANLRKIEIIEVQYNDNDKIKVINRGYFHQFINDFTSDGYIVRSRTMALIENEDGSMTKVPICSIKFVI